MLHLLLSVVSTKYFYVHINVHLSNSIECNVNIVIGVQFLSNEFQLLKQASLFQTNNTLFLYWQTAVSRHFIFSFYESKFDGQKFDNI